MLALGRRSASDDGRLRDDELLVPLLSIDGVSNPDEDEDEATHSGVPVVPAAACPIPVAEAIAAAAAPAAIRSVNNPLPPGGRATASVQSGGRQPDPEPQDDPAAIPGPTDVPVDDGLMALEPDEEVVPAPELDGVASVSEVS